MAPNKKIFVVISGRDDTSKGLYYDWQEVKDHVQGVKKSSGIRILWKSFEGANREDAAKEYWHEHHSTSPTCHRRPTSSNTSGSRDQDRGRDRRRSSSRERERLSQDRASHVTSPRDRPRSRSAQKSTSYRDRPRGRSARSQHTEDFSQDDRKSSRNSPRARDSSRPRNSSREKDYSDRPRTRELSRARESSRTRTPSWDDQRSSSSGLIPDPFNTVANRFPGSRHNPDPKLYQHWRKNSVAPEPAFGEPGTFWAEHYLQLRLRKLEHLRQQLPSPPGRKPTGSSIVTERWCDDNSIPIPTDLVDREYKLTTETYRKVLYTESWSDKEKYIVEYIETVDGQRDFTLNHMSDVIYQCVTRQTFLLSKNAADVEQLFVSQSIQKSLFEQNQRL